MTKRWRIFNYTCPSEQIGIVWVYAGVLEVLAYTDRPKVARAFFDALKARCDKGEIDGDNIEVRLRPSGIMGGKVIVLWEE